MLNLFGEEIVSDEIVVEKVKAPSPFDWINSITQGSDMRDVDPSLKSFNPFSVIRGLGQHEELVRLANILNQNPHIPKEAQYIFLKNVAKTGRLPRVSWGKDETSKEITAICETFACNKVRAGEYLSLLKPDVVKDIVKKHKKRVKK